MRKLASAKTRTPRVRSLFCTRTPVRRPRLEQKTAAFHTLKKAVPNPHHEHRPRRRGSRARTQGFKEEAEAKRRHQWPSADCHAVRFCGITGWRHDGRVLGPVAGATSLNVKHLADHVTTLTLSSKTTQVRQVHPRVQDRPEVPAFRKEQADHHQQQLPAPAQIRNRVLRHARQDGRAPLQRKCVCVPFFSHSIARHA